MAEQSIDTERLKNEQKRDWDAAAAGWKKWWPVLERGAQPVSNRLVELARIGAGARVLDVATGSGEPAVSAARRVAPGGRVIAVDQSPGMLAIARERAEALGITNVDFRESDGDLAYAWASPPPLWAPFSMFNKAAGSIAFPAMLGLALWGIARGWRAERDAIVFALLWMLVAPIIVLAASYLIRPSFVERYMVSSFVPFFLLAALGIGKVRGYRAQVALLAVVVLLALGHVYSYRRRPHDVQWREAVQTATGTAGRTIAVAPPYAADVVRYYLRDSHSGWSVAPGRKKSAAVAIVADTGVSPAEAARIVTTCPHLLTRLRGVIVRGH